VRRIGVSVGIVVAFTVGLPAAPAQAPVPEQLRLGTVAVQARIGGDLVRSAGTVIDADAGLVLTSVRTVWGAKALRLSTGVGLLYGRIVARAPCTGIALVEIQPRIPGLVALTKRAHNPAAGQRLTAVGRVRGERADRLLRTALRRNARVIPGSPLLDGAGRLTGLVTRTRPATAVPWRRVRARLAELKPGKRRVYVGWRDEYRCAARLHAFAAAHHPGYRPLDARLNRPLGATRLRGTEGLDR